MVSLEGRDLAPRSQQKRQAIVAAAKKLFLDAGFGETSMDAVAKEAGVSKRTVYSHFEGKEALFTAVMKNMCTFLGSGGEFRNLDPNAKPGDMIAGENWSGEPREVLTRVGLSFLNLMLSPGALSLFRTVIAEALRVPELAAAFYNSGPRPLTEKVTQYLIEQDQKGVLAISNPELAAARFLSAVREPIHMEMMLGQSARPDEATVKSLVASAVEDFLSVHAPKR